MKKLAALLVVLVSACGAFTEKTGTTRGALDANGRCEGTVLAWCNGGVPTVIDCATTSNGYTACGLDPDPTKGHSCIAPTAVCNGFDANGT